MQPLIALTDWPKAAANSRQLHVWARSRSRQIVCAGPPQAAVAQRPSNGVRRRNPTARASARSERIGVEGVRYESPEMAEHFGGRRLALGSART
jgi:hypothetical protein